MIIHAGDFTNNGTIEEVTVVNLNQTTFVNAACSVFYFDASL